MSRSMFSTTLRASSFHKPPSEGSQEQIVTLGRLALPATKDAAEAWIGRRGNQPHRVVGWKGDASIGDPHNEQAHVKTR